MASRPKAVTVACLLPGGFVLQFVDGDPTLLAGTDDPTKPGLTENVDGDRVRAWMIEHAMYEPVAAGLIYVAPAGDGKQA